MRIRRRSGPGDGVAGWGVADGRGYSPCTGRKYFAQKLTTKKQATRQPTKAGDKSNKRAARRAGHSGKLK